MPVRAAPAAHLPSPALPSLPPGLAAILMGYDAAQTIHSRVPAALFFDFPPPLDVFFLFLGAVFFAGIGCFAGQSSRDVVFVRWSYPGAQRLQIRSWHVAQPYFALLQCRRMCASSQSASFCSAQCARHTWQYCERSVI